MLPAGRRWVQRLTEQGPEVAARPQLVRGKWNKPKVSLRRLGEWLRATVPDPVERAARRSALLGPTAAAVAAAREGAPRAVAVVAASQRPLDYRAPKGQLHQRAKYQRERAQERERRMAQLPKLLKDWAKSRERSDKEPRGVELLLRNRNPKAIRHMRSMMKSVKEETVSDEGLPPPQ